MEDKKMETPAEIISKELLKYQPHEIIGAIFDYFAMALHDFPDAKMKEFFIEFEKGVKDQMAYHRKIVANEK